MKNLQGIGVGANALKNRISAFLGDFEKHVIPKQIPVTDLVYKSTSYKSGSQLPVIDDTFTPFGARDFWGGKKDSHAWFYAKINFEKLEGYRCDLAVETQLNGWDASNPQILVYIDGKTVQGLDTHHRSIAITDFGEKDVYMYAYTGTNIEDLLSLFVSVKYIDLAVEKFYYDVYVPNCVLAFTDERSPEYVEIIKVLNDAINIVDTSKWSGEKFISSVKKASEYLRENLYDKCAPSDKKVACIGHTHIDLAWMWPRRQTVEKAQRSFANVVALMERYPSYKFTSSQPFLYESVKKECPELYEKIKQLVAEGRWETEGGMYVEADCNVPSGESFVRQFTYGKGFFKDEFGVDSRVLWLPDVFGYSASLPQIMKKCGVDDFVTSKISWNDTNMMPYDVFKWTGIDGTSVTTHFITGQATSKDIVRYTTYVSDASPSMISGAYIRNQQKDVKSEAIMTVGWGDGGGGSTPYDCEMVDRMKNALPNMPCASFKTVNEYLDGFRKDLAEGGEEYLPEWRGELYLEYHRGTYTSQANNKKNNRKCEFALQNAETLSVIGKDFEGDCFIQSEYDEKWKSVLFNQFHGILPGSSISEVYRDSDMDYAEVWDFANKQTDFYLSEIAKKSNEKGLLVYNPNSFEFNGYVENGGVRYPAFGIKSKGYKVIKPVVTTSKVVANENEIENEYLRLRFDKDMNIVSVYDKRVDRELLKEDGAIRFVAYEDVNTRYDAWEVSLFYRQKEFDCWSVESVEVVREADRAGVKVIRKLNDSTISDTIYLYDGDSRIEFANEIDWHADHTLLKREFPLDMVTNKAVCDVQFGVAERNTHSNTSWDVANFEVCAHKFVDVGEVDYGVALINESKYGYGIKNNNLSLSLLRSPTYPDENCDRGKHTIKYTLYPHESAFASSDVVKRAYELNNPCKVVETTGDGVCDLDYSLVSTKDEKVVIDTVKRAGKGEGVVVRIYEPVGRRGNEKITFGYGVNKAYLCDLLENEICEIEVKDNSIDLPYKPFEIITIKTK
ncbi:MAG: alpha-mannosidase [Clostridia bacterium]|nr:alpha-mannosidase [Clostridia bacterium]